MTANLIAIAGIPSDQAAAPVGGPRYRQGQLPIGDVGPTPEQAAELRWISVGCFGAAALIAYMITRRAQAR